MTEAMTPQPARVAAPPSRPRPAASPAPFVVLGIDPGPRSHGWALLALTRPGRAAYLAHGEHTGDPRALFRRPELGRLDLVAVETPAGGIYSRARAAGLLATAVEAGRLQEAARATCDRVVAYSAEVWRKALLDNASAQDEAIHRVIVHLVTGWPPWANVHARDAAGVALYAAERWRLEQRINGRKEK